LRSERWRVSPEVAGELGENTLMDSSIHPPRVSHLHYRFEGWLGDDLLQTFPCFLVSASLAEALERAGLVGIEVAQAEVSLSPEFKELYPGRSIPDFRWLKITSKERDADFWVTPDFELEVSDRALHVLRTFSLAHALIEPAVKPPPDEEAPKH
jgi:hypothetical protein